MPLPSCRSRLIPYSEEIVLRCGKDEQAIDPFDPPRARLPHQPDAVGPPVDLLDQLSILLAHRVAVVPRRPAIDGTPPVLVVLGYVRSDVAITALLNAVLCIEVSVGTRRTAP